VTRVSPSPQQLQAALGAGAQPGLVRAPGRVNLIGEHTDYNEGLVLPMAIDRECLVAYRPRPDGQVHARSLDGPDPTGLARAAAQVLDGLGRPPIGIDAVLASDVPIGAGLASSAAVVVGLSLALCEAAEWTLPAVELADACRRAETLATGVPCGLMDPLASLAGGPGMALLIDCRSLAVEPVPVGPGVEVVVADSGQRRRLADSAYAERRQACARAARELGLGSLRDAAPDQVAGDPVARHVVSENRRVGEMAAALRAREWERAGALLDAGHASLRDDFGVSTPQLDRLAGELRAAGAYGARMTGAGFGGCVVALAPPDAARLMTAGRPDRMIVCAAAAAIGV
jgi:galactokinase